MTSAAAGELAEFLMDAGARQPQDLGGARRQERASFLKALAAKKVAAAEDVGPQRPGPCADCWEGGTFPSGGG